MEMNAKQALRAAAKHIEELEYLNMKMVQDIKDYNACILDMIAGGDPCQWCEDLNECQLEAKGKGCGEWMLRYLKGGEPDAEGEADQPVLNLAEQ